MYRRSTDPFARLMPAEVGRMPVAWHQLRIPGPPRAFALRPEEQHGNTPMERFRRRCIQVLEIPETAAKPRDRLALIDKAAPHALFDLMLSEVSPPSAEHPSKADASAVAPATGRILWQTAANFRRFVANPAIRRAFDLEGGWPQLALNCDPHTNDRESVQALKQFHLHLIYWRACELQPLQQAERLADQRDPDLVRQCLDPLSFLGPALLHQRLARLDLARAGVNLLPPDPAATCAGRQPLGCLLQLAHWDVLATAAFEQLIRSLHRCLVETATLLLRAFTGAAQPPAPWRRHRLLPRARIAEQLGRLGLGAENEAGLLALAQRLHDLPAPVAESLRRASAAQRMRCMTLNQPAYSLTLSPMDARGTEASAADGPLLLSLQVKLLSGIGGAGLLSFPALPSVRVLRAQGCFTEAHWQRRADFQRRFALYNSRALQAPSAGNAGLACGPIGRLRNFATGWSH